MRVKAIRQHRSTHGFHMPGDEYEDTKANAEYKIERGIVEEVKAKKKVEAAPENKKQSSRETK